MGKTFSALIAVGCLAVMSGCGSDTDGSASSVVDTASSSSLDSLPSTTPPATTAPSPATSEPSTTTIGRSETATTVTPTATVAPTTTVTPTTTVGAAKGAIDTPAKTIFGLHLFAERPSDDVVTVVSDRLGAPSSDTGFVAMPADFACTGKQSYRVVRWGDLRMTFTQGYVDPNAPDVPLIETENMIAWSVGDDLAAPLAPTDEPPTDPAPTGITTGEGLGVGSSRAELQAEFGENILDDPTGDRVSVYIPGVEGGAPTAASFVFEGDTITGIGAGPPDCLDPDGER